MPVITHSDYLLQVSGAGLIAVPGVWVRLLNNSTATNYYSTAVTTSTGAFTHSAVPGDYSAFYGTAATVAGTPTLANAHWAVPVTAGDDAVLGSATLVVSSPYAANANALPGAITSAADPFNVLTDGAKADSGVTDNQAAFAATLARAVAAGGGVVYVPMSGTGIYGLATRWDVTAASNVWLYIDPGVKLSWYGATGQTMFYSAPALHANLFRFRTTNLYLDARNIVGVTQWGLQSCQTCLFEHTYLANGPVSGAITTPAMLLQTSQLGSDSRNNFAMNVFLGLRIQTGLTAITLSDGATLNEFFGVFIDDLYQTGIRYVQNCDSNKFHSTRISATNAPNANWAGVIYNDSATPAADVNVYNNQFFGISVDNNGGPASASAIVLNWQRQSQITGLWTAVGKGSPGTTIKDNNSQSHWIELLSDNLTTNTSTIYTKNWRMGPLTVGGDLNNSLLIQGAANGGTPSIAAQGISDANVNMFLNPKGGGSVVFNQQAANYMAFTGGSDGIGSAPYLSTNGAAADIDIRTSLQGKGRLTFLGNNGLAFAGTAPTVGSGGAGTSALSILANSTNMAGQFQVTLTGVVAGAVLGVIAFGSPGANAAPLVVMVSLAAPTAGVATPLIAGADTYTTSGFTIRALNGPTNGTYIINYWVAFKQV